MGVNKAGGSNGSNGISNNSGGKVGGGSPKSASKTTYTVKSGDTLSQISQKLGKNVSGLMANNPQIKDANKISVGDKINISSDSAKKSAANGYTVKSGDTLSKIAQKNNTTVGNLLRANPNAAKNANLIYPGQKLNIPAAGKSVDSPAPVDGAKPVKGSSKGVNTQLPANGVGYTSYYSATRKYGTASTVQKLETIAKEWNKRHPNLPVQIGDMSKKGGGDISGHKSHEKGVDVDLRPFRKDGKQGPVTVKDKNYDAKTTREFVKMVKEMYPNSLIGFNDPVLNKSGATRNWDNHDNHLHIRF